MTAELRKRLTPALDAIDTADAAVAPGAAPLAASAATSSWLQSVVTSRPKTAAQRQAASRARKRAARDAAQMPPESTPVQCAPAPVIQQDDTVMQMSAEPVAPATVTAIDTDQTSDIVTSPPLPPADTDNVTQNEAITDATPVLDDANVGDHVTPPDLAALDQQLLSVAAQLATARSEFARLRRARQAAELQHAAAQERRVLQQFAEGSALDDPAFAILMAAVQRDPRALTMPRSTAAVTPARTLLHEVIDLSQTLLTYGVGLHADDAGTLRPARIEVYADHRPTAVAEAQELLAALAACEQRWLQIAGAEKE